MKRSIKFRSLAFVFALALGMLASCKDKETTVEETTTTETTIDIDTSSLPPVTPEETTPADTTTTGAPAGSTAPPSK